MRQRKKKQQVVTIKWIDLSKSLDSSREEDDELMKGSNQDTRSMTVQQLNSRNKISQQNRRRSFKSLLTRPYRLLRHWLPGSTKSHVFFLQLLLLLNSPFYIITQHLDVSSFELNPEFDFEQLQASELSGQSSFDYLPNFTNKIIDQTDDLLEAAAHSSPASSTRESSASSSSSKTESKTVTESTTSTGEKKRPSGGAANILADQIGAVSSLLDHFGGGVTGGHAQSAADALIAGVTSAVLSPLKASSRPRPDSGATSNAPSKAGGKPPSVGQQQQDSLLDGGIEYDPNQNQINGFIEWPNLFNFSSGSLTGALKPSTALIKPLLFAALKTAPIKLGSVGWKLLQLIALKKIYKTHHPNSGEIIFEQELNPREPTTSFLSRRPQVMSFPQFIGNDFGGLSSGSSTHSFSIPNHPFTGKISKMGFLSPNRGSHYHPTIWSFGGSNVDSLYHRQATPSLGLHPSYNAAAAAAAAAASATLHSHWATAQQFANSAAGESDSDSSSSEQQSAKAGARHSRSPANRKGRNALQHLIPSWLSLGGPAHAYAAAAAASAATAATLAGNQVDSEQLLMGVDRQQQRGSSQFFYQSLIDRALAQHHYQQQQHQQQQMLLKQQQQQQAASSADDELDLMSSGWPDNFNSPAISSHQRLGQTHLKHQLSNMQVGSSSSANSPTSEHSSLSSIQDFDDLPLSRGHPDNSNNNNNNL